MISVGTDLHFIFTKQKELCLDLSVASQWYPLMALMAANLRILVTTDTDEIMLWISH